MTVYIGLLRKDAASDFGVDFPDFPGCVTAGRTLEEARIMAAEALALHVGGMLEDGAILPEASSLDTIMADPENGSAVAMLVEVPSRHPRTVRVNVMLPEDLLRDIDQVSKNRSRFLADAARAQLAQTSQR